MGQGLLTRIARLISIVFTTEKIDELPPVPGNRSRVPLLGMIAGREDLPEDSPALAGERGFFAWLLRAETLPLDRPPLAAGRTSFLGTLLSRERLPEDPAPTGKGRAPGGRA